MYFPVLRTRAGEHWVMYCNPCQASPEVPASVLNNTLFQLSAFLL